MNGEVCCILGVCCPTTDEQATALATEMSTDLHMPNEHAAPIAKWLLTHFDLAPAGTLAPYRNAILSHERKGK